MRTSLIFLVALAGQLIGLPVTQSRISAQSVHTTTGIYSDVMLEDVTPDSLVFRYREGRKPSLSIPVEQLVRWGVWRGVRDKQALWLAGGSWICGNVALRGEGASVDSAWLSCPKLDYESVRGAVLQPPVSHQAWLELKSQMMLASGEQDTVWIRSGSKVSGIIRWDRSTSSEVLFVETANGPLELDLQEVAAIVLSPALMGRLPKNRQTLQIALQDGSKLYVRELSRSQPEQLQLKLVSSAVLKTLDDSKTFATSVEHVANQTHRTLNLGQLEAASYKHLPDGSLSWPLGIDGDVYGRPLMVGDGVVDRGIALHSASQVAYRWDGSPATLLAEVVFAKPARGAKVGLGSVDVKVLLARNGQLVAVEEFSLTRATHASKTLAVDLTEAKLIVLVVEQADRGQAGDHILWLNARIHQTSDESN